MSSHIQPIDAKIMTPSGPVAIGDVKIGDYVLGKNKRTKVIDVFSRGRKMVYEVVCSDGSKTHCGGDHAWLTRTFFGESTRTTKEIAATIDYVHKLPTCLADFDEQSVSVDPHFLGRILGGGNGLNRIPREYLHNSGFVRWELLLGLTAENPGMHFTSERVRKEIKYLVRSLGGTIHDGILEFNKGRTVVGVTPSGTKECRCIQVSGDGLYLTDDFIVT